MQLLLVIVLFCLILRARPLHLRMLRVLLPAPLGRHVALLGVCRHVRFCIEAPYILLKHKDSVPERTVCGRPPAREVGGRVAQHARSGVPA